MLYEIGFDLIKWKLEGLLSRMHVFSLSNKCFWILESFEYSLLLLKLFKKSIFKMVKYIFEFHNDGLMH